MKKETKIFTQAYSDYYEIENMSDLKRNQLTLAEYDTVFDGLKILSNLKADSLFVTFMDGVANWFKRHGFKVSMDKDNVNYIISL